jgi:hypothetical protein
MRGCLECFQRPLFHLQVRFHIVMGRDGTFVSKPQRDDCIWNARLQHVHGNRMANEVRKDPLFAKLRKLSRCNPDGEIQPISDSNASKRRPRPPRKQRFLRVTWI